MRLSIANTFLGYQKSVDLFFISHTKQPTSLPVVSPHKALNFVVARASFSFLFLLFGLPNLSMIICRDRLDLQALFLFWLRPTRVLPQAYLLSHPQVFH